MGPVVSEWPSADGVRNVEDTSRFVISRFGSCRFALNENYPWSRADVRGKRWALCLGWRCVSFVPPGLFKTAQEFIRSSHGRHTYTSAGHTVNVSVRWEPVQSDFAKPLVVDLWTDRPRFASSELRQAADALERVRKQIQARLEFDASWELAREQEFLEIKLPRFIARRFDTARSKASIVLRLKREYRSQESMPSLQIVGSRLILGPEPDGAVEAVCKFLDEETSENAKDILLSSLPYSRLAWVPLCMVGLLLLTWTLPLRPWSVALVAFLLLVAMGTVLLPMRDVGWRTTLRQTTTVATLGFFGIGVFGIAYSMCALMSDEALGHVTRLGYPFLVSTALGVAGGVVGDNPKGAALVVAHIQLLVFLGGIIGVVATLLRIERAVRQRG